MKLSALLHRGKPAMQQDDHWIPLSDLMTCLMMIFLLVAVMFMVQVEAEREQVEVQRDAAEQAKAEAEEQADSMRGVAARYQAIRTRLHDDLKREFAADLPGWKATLDRDLSIRFDDPDVLFDAGKAALKPRFMDILGDFFPRYVKIISAAQYRDGIEEIRIEGHTSTAWSARSDADEAYFRNMELSQSRTRSALQFVLLLPGMAAERHWLTTHVTANGLSSSHPRLNADGTENREASQRVEFRLRTNADARIDAILDAAR